MQLYKMTINVFLFILGHILYNSFDILGQNKF